MDMATMLMLALGLLGIMVVCLLGGLWVLMGALYPEPTDTQNRLKTVVQVRRPGDEAFQQWLQQQTANQQKELNLGPLNKLGLWLAHKLTLDIRLSKAGVAMAPSRYILLFVFLPIGLGIWGLSFKAIPVIPSIGLLLSPILGFFYLAYKAKKRYEKLEQQLPDALSILTSSLRAGHSFQAATQSMAEQLPQPIQPIFEDIHNDLKLGVPVKESLNKMLETVEVVDFRIFATAVLVQRESGGNLAEIMDQLATTIRERAKLKRQISVLTAQPRLSSYIIGAAPIVMYIIIQFLMPGYTQVLEEHPLGPFIIGFVVGMQIMGFYVIRRIVDIRI